METIIKVCKSKNSVDDLPNCRLVHNLPDLKLFGKYTLKYGYLIGDTSTYYLYDLNYERTEKLNDYCIKYADKEKFKDINIMQDDVDIVDEEEEVILSISLYEKYMTDNNKYSFRITITNK